MQLSISQLASTKSAKMSNLKDFFKPEFESSKPYRGFKELAHGRHKIIRFKLVRNKFAADAESEGSSSTSSPISVMVELEDEVLFLPQHLGRKFNNNPETVRQINESGITFYLYFAGKHNG